MIVGDGPAVMHYLTKRSLRVEQIDSHSGCSCSLFPLVNQLATLLVRDLFGDTDGFPDELPDASASLPRWPEVRIFSMALPSTYQYRIKREILPLCDLSLFFTVQHYLGRANKQCENSAKRMENQKMELKLDLKLITPIMIFSMLVNASDEETCLLIVYLFFYSRYIFNERSFCIKPDLDQSSERKQTRVNNLL